MECVWKQQIRSQLTKRDRLQLGNYGKLVESYTQLLDQQGEEKFHTECKLQKNQEDGELNCSQESSRESNLNTRDCSCCEDSQRLREEVKTLLIRLECIEREHEELLSRLMEEKLKEAEKMNQINDRICRYQRKKEKIYQTDHN